MDNLPGIQDAILNPSTVALRNVNQALRIIRTSPRGLIKREARGKYTYDVSPSIKVPVTYQNGEEHVLNVAVAVRLPGRLPWQKWGQQAYLIADENLDGPVAAINSEPHFDLRLPQSGTDISDEEIDLVLNKIEEGVEAAIAERARRTKRFVGFVGRAAGVAVIIALIAAGITWFVRDHNQDVAEQHAAERASAEAAAKAKWDAFARYDSKGIVLKSELVTPGNAGVAALDREALEYVGETPEFEDLLDNPRKLSISAGSSRDVAIAPPGKGVRVATNAPKGHVIVDVLEDGSVWVTALPDANKGDNTNPPSYVVLIQSGPIVK